MKKIYMQPEWKWTVFEEADVITASGDGDYSFDPNNTFGDDSKVDTWTW